MTIKRRRRISAELNSSVEETDLKSKGTRTTKGDARLMSLHGWGGGGSDTSPCLKTSSQQRYTNQKDGGENSQLSWKRCPSRWRCPGCDRCFCYHDGRNEKQPILILHHSAPNTWTVSPPPPSPSLPPFPVPHLGTTTCPCCSLKENHQHKLLISCLWWWGGVSWCPRKPCKCSGRLAFPRDLVSIAKYWRNQCKCSRWFAVNLCIRHFNVNPVSFSVSL